MTIDGITIIGLAFLAATIAAAAALYASRRRPPEPKCKHEVTTDIRWTQDGWVSVCLVCREWLYHGCDEHPRKAK